MEENTVKRPVQWQSCSRTHVGNVRQINEDAVMCRSDINLWAVADGMGGYSAGDIASKMIVNSLLQLESHDELAVMVDRIEDCLIEANTRILEYADIMLEQKTIGSTVVNLLIKGNTGVCLWAGDSRLYRYREQNLQQISSDHSRVADMVRQGLLSSEAAQQHPEKNVITRAIGVEKDFSADICVFGARLNDIFLLCSDGLYNMIGKSEVISSLQKPVLTMAADEIIEKVLAAGATDNVSVILVKGVPELPRSQKAFEYKVSTS